MASRWSGSILGLLEKALPAHGEKLRTLAVRARSVGDDELVHDLRVALRRTEALSRLFRGLPGKEDGKEPRASARTLRRRLSLLRSEEVGRALLASRAGATDARLSALVFPGELPAVRVDSGDVEAVARALARWRRRLAAARGGAFAPRARRRHGPPPANPPPAHPARPQSRRAPPSGPGDPSRRADRRQAGPLRPRGGRAARPAVPSAPSSPALLPGCRGRRPRPRRARSTRRVRRGCGHRDRPRIGAAGATPRGRRHAGAPGRPGEG